jgi:hypothetical protein
MFGGIRASKTEFQRPMAFDIRRAAGINSPQEESHVYDAPPPNRLSCQSANVVTNGTWYLWEARSHGHVSDFGVLILHPPMANDPASQAMIRGLV